MKNSDKDPFVHGLKLIMDSEGLKMKPLSLAAGMGESGVRDLFRYGSAPKVSNAHALALALGRTVDEVIGIGMSGVIESRAQTPTVAVAGRVGAGASVMLTDAFSKGDGLYQIACPPMLPCGGVVAVEVEGDSMLPTYEPGSVLFYSRPALGVPTEAINRICVCSDSSGMAWVKQVKAGREEGTFSLLSVNPEAENMHGVKLAWAAPVRFALPPDFVVKL